jgi:segregation and condensation protein B
VDQDSAKRPERPVGPGEIPGAGEAFGLADEDAAAYAEEAARAAARAALAEEAAVPEPEPDGAAAGVALADDAVAAVEPEAGPEFRGVAGTAAEEPGLEAFEAAEASVEGVEPEELAEAPVEGDAGAFEAAPDEGPETGAADAEGAEPPPIEARDTLEARDDVRTPEEEALAQAGTGEVAGEGESLDGVTPAEINEVVEDAGPTFDKLAARAAKLSAEQARNLLQAVLFVSDKPLTVDQLRQATGLDGRKVNKALDRLAGELREGVSGVILSEVAGGWQLRTAPETSEWIRRFLQVKPRRLTRAALETLAIVAYRQPVTRPEVEEIRGVDCGAVLKALIDWKLVKILGRKDEIGRPILYGTTREFLEFFQLKDLASLPTLREFHELSEESRQIVEEELGADAVAGIDGTVDQLADPAYLEAERERVAASEAALADLEKAMAEAETKAGALAAAIAPPKSPPEDEAPPEAS